MDFDDLVDWIRTDLADVRVVIASEDNGAPEAAWGDVFVMHDVPGDDFPFATIVTQDVTGFDDRSQLDREGAFRVNAQVGRRRAAELLATDIPPPPDRHIDYAAADRLLPHPVYAAQGFVSVVNPGPETGELVCRLLREAHERSGARLRAGRADGRDDGR